MRLNVLPVTRWRITPRSVGIAVACFLFAAAVLVAPFDELSRYTRNRIDLFGGLSAVLGEGIVRGAFALLFAVAGIASLRGSRRRPRRGR